MELIIVELKNGEKYLVRQDYEVFKETLLYSQDNCFFETMQGWNIKAQAIVKFRKQHNGDKTNE